MSRGTILVTGASTGIGEATVAHLATLGFHVLAGVRKQADADRVGQGPATPVILDVTDSASIAAAAEQVGAEAGSAGLAGLVNNAGIAVSAPAEFVPVEQFRNQLEVNVTGQLAVTQAMLPMLRGARGRIVNMSSIGGRLAMPIMGPYAASKFALEGISDSLRRELAPHGVRVVLIEPGGIKTPIWDKGTKVADEMLAGMPPDVERLYGAQAEAVRRESVKIATKTGLPPSAVAEVVGTALTARRPRTRYLVGRDAKIMARVSGLLPDRVFDFMMGRAMR